MIFWTVASIFTINTFLYGCIIYASFSCIKKRKSGYAYMLLYGSLLSFLSTVLQQLYQNVIRPNLEGYSLLQLTIPSVVFSVLGALGFVVFSVGFLILIKKKG
jgi:hypothetical protein